MTNPYRSLSPAQRLFMARRWFQPFASLTRELGGEIRIATSSGKPHLYLPITPAGDTSKTTDTSKTNTELCITRKGYPAPGYIVHYPAYGGPRAHTQNRLTSDEVIALVTDLRRGVIAVTQALDAFETNQPTQEVSSV